MKTLFLECTMGASGDMLIGALLELHNNPTDFMCRLNSLGIPGVKVKAEKGIKCGITGTHVSVSVYGVEEKSVDHKHDHEHHHNHEGEHSHHKHEQEHHHIHNRLHEIKHIIEKLNVSPKVKENAIAVYQLIADAESHVHGVPVREVHFHEVGSMDAVTDITAVCMLIEELAPDQIFASPVHVGSGQVRCAHGILPVPAPATAYILQGIPSYGGNIQGELCTPTGAALLKHFADNFGSMPIIAATKIGYGMGTKDFEAVNCLRAFLGETVEICSKENTPAEEITELVCNLDDMTGEAAAFAQQLLLDEGALDVWIIPTVMKKNRSGLMLTCLCHPMQSANMAKLIFKHTTTLGIREYKSRRYVLTRQESSIQTEYGAVRVKKASGFGIIKSKLEYEDIAKIAREKNIPLSEVVKKINTASS